MDCVVKRDTASFAKLLLRDAEEPRGAFDCVVPKVWDLAADVEVGLRQSFLNPNIRALLTHSGHIDELRSFMGPLAAAAGARLTNPLPAYKIMVSEQGPES